MTFNLKQTGSFVQNDVFSNAVLTVVELAH